MSRTVPPLKITVVKRGDGDYHFDHSPSDTVQELLTNGTEVVLDEYFKVLYGIYPRTRDCMDVFLTDDPNFPGKFDTILTKVDELSDEEGTVYADPCTGGTVWLCPWLQFYFGHVPKVLKVNVSKTPLLKMVRLSRTRDSCLVRGPAVVGPLRA